MFPRLAKPALLLLLVFAGFSIAGGHGHGDHPCTGDHAECVDCTCDSHECEDCICDSHECEDCSCDEDKWREEVSLSTDETDSCRGCDQSCH